MTADHLVPDNSNKSGGSGSEGSGFEGGGSEGGGPGGGSPGGAGRLAGRRVARVGFGAMQLERVEDPGRAADVLRYAVAHGVNHIDTAHFYGEANTCIKDALAPYPDSLVLATKVGAVRDSGNKMITAQKPAELREQVEVNLRALGTDHVAVVNLRRTDAPPGIVAEGDQKVDLDSQLAELIALRDQGKIGAIGLSHVDAAQLRRALPAGIACVQNAYSLLDRAAQPVLDVCQAHGIAWVPYFPLGSAFPSIPKVTDHPAVIDAAATLGVTPAQVGLAWLLASYENTLLIPGTSSVAHLAENIAAGDVHLPPEIVATLDEVTGAA